jgi:hypothetical protein
MPTDYQDLQLAVLTNDLTKLSAALEQAGDVNATGGSGINVLHYFIGEAGKLSLDPGTRSPARCSRAARRSIPKTTRETRHCGGPSWTTGASLNRST